MDVYVLGRLLSSNFLSAALLRPWDDLVASGVLRGSLDTLVPTSALRKDSLHVSLLAGSEAGQRPGNTLWIVRGNATEGEDVGGGPGKSSLFFLTACHPEIGLSGARV